MHSRVNKTMLRHSTTGVGLLGICAIALGSHGGCARWSSNTSTGASRALGSDGPSMTSDAKEVIAKCVRAYKDCKSYEDTFEFQGLIGSATIIGSGKTLYKRPLKFRVESTYQVKSVPESYKCLFIGTEDGVRWYNPADPEGRFFHQGAPFLRILYGDLNVPTGGLGLIVPASLDPRESVEDLYSRLVEPAIRGEAKVGEVTCTVVAGRIPSRDGEFEMIFSIGKEDSLLRRIEKKGEKGQHFWIEFKPRVGHEIPDSAFEAPPVQRESSTSESAPREMEKSVKEAITRCEAAYKEVRTYEDAFEFATTLTHMQAKPFLGKGRTLFVRADKFQWRVEYRLGTEQLVVVTRMGGKSWIYRSTEGETNEGPIAREIQADMVLGPDLASSVPALLLVPDVLSRHVFAKVPGWSSSPDESIEGVECIVLEAADLSSKPPGTYKVWIGKSDHLIRRIENTHPDGRRSVITIRPKVNGKINDSEFMRKPQDGGS